MSVVTDLDGVVSASADYRKNSATVVYEPAKVTPERIAEEINAQTYYKARAISGFVKTVRLKVPGLDTRAEAVQVGKALSAVEGYVGGALLTEGLSIDYDERQTSPAQLVELIGIETPFTASVDTTSAVSGVKSSATMVVKIEGMTDKQASSRVTSALVLDGILDGSVNTTDATLTIVYDESRLTPERIVSTLQDAVPEKVELLSVTGSGTGGGVFTSAWFVLSLVGAAVAAFLMWPIVKRRLRPATVENTPPGSGYGRGGS